MSALRPPPVRLRDFAGPERADAQALDPRRLHSRLDGRALSTRRSSTSRCPAIQRDLGGGLALQQWVVDGYLLTLGSLILLGGSLGDLFGSRRVLVVGLLSFGATSLVCALAWNGDSLIVARALQGVAGALLTPAALATITSVFSGEERGAAIGTWTAWTGIAFLIGPLAGGWLVSVASWRAIFLINPPLVLGDRRPRARRGRTDGRPRPAPPVDVVGGVLCVLGLAGPVDALIEEPRYGFGNPLIPAGSRRRRSRSRPHSSPGSGAREHRCYRFGSSRGRNFSSRQPRDLRRLRRALDVDVLPRHLPATARGVHTVQSGLATIPITVVMFFLSYAAGGWRCASGRGSSWASALSSAPSRSSGSPACAAASPTGASCCRPLLLFALGLSAIVAPLTSTVLADAGPATPGVASGVNNAIARIAGLLGIAIVGAAVAGPANRLDAAASAPAMTITAALARHGRGHRPRGDRNRRSQEPQGR